MCARETFSIFKRNGGFSTLRERVMDTKASLLIESSSTMYCAHACEAHKRSISNDNRERPERQHPADIGPTPPPEHVNCMDIINISSSHISLKTLPRSFARALIFPGKASTHLKPYFHSTRRVQRPQDSALKSRNRSRSLFPGEHTDKYPKPALQLPRALSHRHS